MCKVPCSPGDVQDVHVHPAVCLLLETWCHTPDLKCDFRGIIWCFLWDTLTRRTFQIAWVPWKLLQGKQLVKPLLISVSSTCQIHLIYYYSGAAAILKISMCILMFFFSFCFVFTFYTLVSRHIAFHGWWAKKSPRVAGGKNRCGRRRKLSLVSPVTHGHAQEGCSWRLMKSTAWWCEAGVLFVVCPKSWCAVKFNFACLGASSFKLWVSDVLYWDCVREIRRIEVAQLYFITGASAETEFDCDGCASSVQVKVVIHSSCVTLNIPDFWTEGLKSDFQLCPFLFDLCVFWPRICQLCRLGYCVASTACYEVAQIKIFGVACSVQNKDPQPPLSELLLHFLRMM